MLNKGEVKVITQLSDNKSNTLVIIARPRPHCLAFFCMFLGSLEERMEIKMMLSIPSTISRRVKVISEIQASGLLKSSIGLQIFVAKI
jgi:hypothetical protein